MARHAALIAVLFAEHRAASCIASLAPEFGHFMLLRWRSGQIGFHTHRIDNEIRR
jgi:hypothetical protein